MLPTILTPMMPTIHSNVMKQTRSATMHNNKFDNKTNKTFTHNCIKVWNHLTTTTKNIAYINNKRQIDGSRTYDRAEIHKISRFIHVS